VKPRAHGHKHWKLFFHPPLFVRGGRRLPLCAVIDFPLPRAMLADFFAPTIFFSFPSCDSPFFPCRSAYCACKNHFFPALFSSSELIFSARCRSRPRGKGLFFFFLFQTLLFPRLCSIFLFCFFPWRREARPPV